MMIIVTGGSASGKSEFAEQLVLGYGAFTRIYLATMQVWDEEGRERVCRHRQMREKKAFITIECAQNLSGLEMKPIHGAVVLLECMSNLAANEWYETGGSPAAIQQRILAGIGQLEMEAEALIVVTNEIFSDAGGYSRETEAYLELLGQINQQLAVRADEVIEVVYGIPVWHKRCGGKGGS